MFLFLFGLHFPFITTCFHSLEWCFVYTVRKVMHYWIFKFKFSVTIQLNHQNSVLPFLIKINVLGLELYFILNVQHSTLGHYLPIPPICFSTFLFSLFFPFLSLDLSSSWPEYKTLILLPLIHLITLHSKNHEADWTLNAGRSISATVRPWQSNFKRLEMILDRTNRRVFSHLKKKKIMVMVVM